MTIHRSLIASCFAVLILPALAFSQVEEGRARFVPWSGYWWKTKEGRMLRPLGKYDQLTGKKARSWESQNKDRSSAAPWAGYCHAWSAASLMEREPRRPRTVTGPNGRSMTLSVGDQKALLTIIHDGDDANLVGKRYNGAGDDMQDIYPDVLWRHLRLYLKQRGVPLVLDIDCKSPVWNYPVYRYRIEYRDFGPSGQKLGKMQIWMADDKVKPDHIGTLVKKKTYQFTFRMEGGSPVMGTGKWYGASRNDHPDFGWYPTMVKPKNPYIDAASIRRMLGTSGTRVVGRGTEDEPGEVKDIDANRLVAVSSTEVAVLVAGNSSRFPLELTLTNEIKPLAPGTALTVRGRSNKDGHLYLFGVAVDGQVRLLYPLTEQNNRVHAGKAFEIADKVGVVAPKGPGSYRLKALVSAKPLSLGSLQEAEDESPKLAGFGRGFDWSPSEEEVVQDLLSRVAQKKLTLAELEESTGVKPAELLSDYARAEVTFRVK